MLLSLLVRYAFGSLVGACLYVACVSAQPKYGGQLVVGVAQDPLIVDPLRTGSPVEFQFSKPVYETLFDINAQGKTVPFLAQGIQASDDLKTWRISLRPGIRFHDGTPLDADAVVANLERLSDPANRCRCLNTMADFKGWKVIDPLTVEIELVAPNAALPTLLAEAPGMMVSPTAFKADPQGIGIRPVGTGPFRFVEWVRNSRYVTERNPDYWQEGKPYLDKVILQGMQNTETRAAAFRSGQMDIIMQPAIQFTAAAQKDKRYVVHIPPGLGTYGVYFNFSKPPLDDIRVRRAVAHAMDRDLLIRTLYFGIPPLAYSHFGPGLADIKQPVDIYPKYDLDKARALLAEYGKPVAFTLSYNNAPDTLTLVQSLQQMWAQVGMQVTLNPLDQNRLVQNVVTRQFDAAIFRSVVRADPDISAFNFLHSRDINKVPSSNYGAYGHPKVDVLLERGRSTADPDARAAIYSELARVLIQEMFPHAYLNVITDTIITKPHVRGITVIPDGLIRFDSVWRE